LDDFVEMCGIFIVSVMVGPLVILARNCPKFKLFCSMMGLVVDKNLSDREVWNVCL
jgi:hypothetical protein